MDRQKRDESMPMSISALQLGLLRSYSHLMQPPALGSSCNSYAPALGSDSRNNNGFLASLDFSPVLGAFQPYSPLRLGEEPYQDCKTSRGVTNSLLISGSSICSRRTRGEKKPIPEEQKDDRYFERRKRNNQAAKKSRDARKYREDQIALRAAILEHENAMLRAQILTMRDETQALRRLLLLNTKPEVSNRMDLKEAALPQGTIVAPINQAYHAGRNRKDVFE